MHTRFPLGKNQRSISVEEEASLAWDEAYLKLRRCPEGIGGSRIESPSTRTRLKRRERLTEASRRKQDQVPSSQLHLAGTLGSHFDLAGWLVPSAGMQPCGHGPRV